MATISHRLRHSIKHFLLPPHRNPNPNLAVVRHLCSSSFPPIPSRSKTPLETQFDAWIARLSPGFTPADVDAALRSIPDPDLALDVFRWTALRPGYRHSPAVYHTMLLLLASTRRSHLAETLIADILAGIPSPPDDLPLANAAIRFCCNRRHLFSTAFDLFKRRTPHPSNETYALLLAAILRRFGKPPVSFVYLRAVRSLVKQMKATGVVPDTLTLNLIIKAFARCLEMDEAIRFFKEMGLYGCEPNEYSYGYIAKGLCEKGRVEQGFGYYKEMRDKGLVPTSTVYSAVICSLAMEGRFEEAVGAVFDMLENRMAPDVLTYRTVLEGLCREGRTEEAFKLLEELGDRPGAMSRKMFSDLRDGLHWLCQPHD